MKKVGFSLIIFILFGIIVVLSKGSIFETKNSQSIEAGEKIYHKQCLTCHGETGKGEGSKLGTAINNQHFLSNVSNKDLYNYLKFGRKGTAMPAYGISLSEKNLNNLVAFIKNWQSDKTKFDVPNSISGDLDNGIKQYNLYCLSCHGDAGAGKDKMGTALSNPDYLKYTTDKQIWISIAYGRENTRMGASLKGLDGVRQLKKEDISDIVSYIRSLQFQKKQ
jgi:cytochrome c oxidase cbb3-type subunit III